MLPAAMLTAAVKKLIIASRAKKPKAIAGRVESFAATGDRQPDRVTGVTGHQRNQPEEASDPC